MISKCRARGRGPLPTKGRLTWRRCRPRRDVGHRHVERAERALAGHAGRRAVASRDSPSGRPSRCPARPRTRARCTGSCSASSSPELAAGIAQVDRGRPRRCPPGRGSRGAVLFDRQTERAAALAGARVDHDVVHAGRRRRRDRAGARRLPRAAVAGQVDGASQSAPHVKHRRRLRVGEVRAQDEAVERAVDAIAEDDLAARRRRHSSPRARSRPVGAVSPSYASSSARWALRSMTSRPPQVARTLAASGTCVRASAPASGGASASGVTAASVTVPPGTGCPPTAASGVGVTLPPVPTSVRLISASWPSPLVPPAPPPPVLPPPAVSPQAASRALAVARSQRPARLFSRTS
jgi:hypothetical protein